MTARPLQMVLRQVSAARRGNLPDGELLAQFVAQRPLSSPGFMSKTELLNKA